MRPPATRHWPSPTAHALAAALLALLAQPAAAAQAARPYPSFAMQRQADALQRCLEREIDPLRLESSLSKNGRLEESVRVTNWSSRCTAPGSAGNRQCTPQNSVRPVVALALTVDDQHSAWSANERTRLEEGIVRTLHDLDDGVVIDGPHRGDASPSSAGSAMLLRVRIDYRGSSIAQRDLDEWLQMPKAVHLDISLVEAAATSHVLAQRKITARVRPRLRTGAVNGYADDWRANTLAAIGKAASEMLQPLACTTPVLQASMSSGKLWLDAAGYAGLAEGQALLLIPSVETSVAALWPIVTISGSGAAGGQRQLEILRGAAESCLAGCRALPL